MSDLAERMRDIFSGSSRKNAGYRGYSVTALKNLEKNNDGPVTPAGTKAASVVVTVATPVEVTASGTEKDHIGQYCNQVTVVTTQKPEVKRENSETRPDELAEVLAERCDKTVATTDTRNDIPAVFAGAYSRLLQTCPDKVDQDRWLRARVDACAFLETWGEQAAALGWAADDLFDLHPTAPLARYDRMGLVWLLLGQTVVALTQDTATISTRSGARVTFRRPALRELTNDFDIRA
jgi:hypothetical protein